MDPLVKTLLLLAALILSVTGGTLTVDLSGQVPTITVCSHEGSYEVPLDMGDADQSAIEHCCGSCMPMESASTQDMRSWQPLLQAKAQAIRIAIAAALAATPSWQSPPPRAPPFAV